MILACPSCATRFRVPDEALGASGRLVRCSVCRREWRVPPAEALRPASAVPASGPIRPARVGEEDVGARPAGDQVRAAPELAPSMPLRREPPPLPIAGAATGRGRRRAPMLLWLVVLLVSAAVLAAVVMPERILGQVPGLAPYLEWLGLAQAGEAAPLRADGVPVAALPGRDP